MFKNLRHDINNIFSASPTFRKTVPYKDQIDKLLILMVLLCVSQQVTFWTLSLILIFQLQHTFEGTI